jgi:aspartate oxidase
MELLNNSPFIRKADTLAGLARRMEVDVPPFLATVERYNEACEQRLQTEPEFGKPLKSSKAFDTPPYYAIQIFPLARKNFGGVKTDLKCRVPDKHFEPIAGLYAAGEVAGMAGGHINGRAGLEGTMLGPAIARRWRLGRASGGPRLRLRRQAEPELNCNNWDKLRTLSHPHHIVIDESTRCSRLSHRCFVA